MGFKRIATNDSSYILAHGRRPSGRGSWAFTFGREEGDIWWAGQSRDAGGSMAMLYSEAKRLAFAEARRRGVETIFVCT